MMWSVDKTTSLCWISKFSEAPPDKQLIPVLPPPGINSWFLRVPLKRLQFEILDSRNATFCLTDWEFTKYVLIPVISPFSNSNNCLGVRICSKVCKLARGVNLFKVPPTPSQGGKPENLSKNSFILKNRAV